MKPITSTLWAVSLSLIMISSGFIIVGSGSPEPIVIPEAVMEPPEPTDGVTDYHSFAEIEAELFQVATEHSDITKLISIGQSWQGRDLWAIKVSDNPHLEEEDEPEVYFNGAHHAREWMTIEVNLYILNYLTDNYGTNSTITDIVDNRQIWIVPCVNPDGRAQDGSLDGDDPTAHSIGDAWNSTYWGWRKNMRDNNEDSTFQNWYDGVDLNRNYGYLWGASGASSDPRYDIYGGEYPFSEPETAAIRDFCRDHNFIFSVSYHSFSQLILYPWGWTHESCPDEDVFVSVGNEMSSVITNKADSEFPGYVPEKGSGLYPTAGSDEDWLYGELGIYAYCIETYPSVQDDDSSAYASYDAVTGEYDLFHPRADKIQPVCEDNLPAAILLCQIADNPFQLMDHVSIEPETAEIRIVNGTSDSVSLDITDDGHRDDSFDIDASEITDWTITPTPSSVSLTRNETQAISLDITVPESASPGTYNIWVNVTSQTNISCKTSSMVTVIVPWPDDISAAEIMPFTELGSFPTGNYRIDGVVENIGGVQVPLFDTDLTITEIGPGSTVTLFQDDMESGMSNWNVVDHDITHSDSVWHQVNDLSASGSYSLWCGPLAGGFYSPDTIQSLVMAEPISLERYNSVTLDFMAYYNTEEYYDFLMVEGSPDNGASWDYITRFDSSIPDWQPQTFDLSPFLGAEEFIFRFRFTSDEATENIGFWLDDVIITADDPDETIIYGPETLSTTVPLDEGISETLSWNYAFSGGTYRASIETFHGNDDNTANNLKDVMFYIDPARTLSEFDGIASVFNTGMGTVLDIDWPQALQINDPITYHAYRFDHIPTELEVNASAPTWSGTSIGFQDTGLTKGQEYFYIVRAEDSLLQMEYNMKILSGTPDMTWYLQVEGPLISGYKNLSAEPMNLGAQASTTEMSAVGDYLVGTSSWMSSPMAYNAATDAEWTFTMHGYSSSDQVTGYLFAKVYEYNSGSPNLMFTTILDEENVGLHTSSYGFSWTHTPPLVEFPIGEQIIVEIWVDVSSTVIGSSGATTNPDFTSDASDWTSADWGGTDYNLENWISSGGNPGGMIDVEFDGPSTGSTQYTRGGYWEQSFTPSDVPTSITLDFDWACSEYVGITGNIGFYAFIDSSPGEPVIGSQVWSASVTSSGSWIQMNLDVSGSVSSASTHYLKMGIWVTGLSRNDHGTGNYDNVQLSWSTPAPTFVLEYDSVTTPSSVIPDLVPYDPGTPYIIDLAGSGDWALISFPLDISGPIQDILGDSDWDIAKWYDNNDPMNPWKTHKIGRTDNDLLTVNNTMGIWLHLTGLGDMQITVSPGAYSPGPVDVILYPGWNLVGYPSATGENAFDSLLGLGVNWISKYQAATPFVADYSDLTQVDMSDGNAYWIHVDALTVWTVDP
ncbi:MAG: hypothetical protein KAJ33_03930 [Thermoplasmata archaeon]|nr:hypothetical protein [Thermoplasmata archaeon]